MVPSFHSNYSSTAAIASTAWSIATAHSSASTAYSHSPVQVPCACTPQSAARISSAVYHSHLTGSTVRGLHALLHGSGLGFDVVVTGLVTGGESYLV